MKTKKGEKKFQTFMFCSTLTRLLDAWGRVRDGLLRPVSDPVCSWRVGTWREASWCWPPGCSSNPFISLISCPSLPITILSCSAGTLIDDTNQILSSINKKDALFSLLYRTKNKVVAGQQNTLYFSHKHSNLNLQTWACSSQIHNHRRNPDGGKDSWKAAVDKNNLVCHQNGVSGRSSGMWRTRLQEKINETQKRRNRIRTQLRSSQKMLSSEII